MESSACMEVGKESALREGKYTAIVGKSPRSIRVLEFQLVVRICAVPEMSRRVGQRYLPCSRHYLEENCMKPSVS